MRVDQRAVYLYRGLFGVGFIVLGLVVAYRVAIVPGPWRAKALGLLVPIVMVALGGVRVGQYVRARRRPRP
jgi:hypothetical protein